MLAEVGKVTGLTPGEIPTSTDGCGVVTFALPLVRMARAYSVFHDLEGGAAVVRAMVRHPELVRGPGAADTELMQTHPGWFAKGGAEGLLCAGSPDGFGLALKAEDGASRPVGPAIGAFLERLGLDPETLGPVPLTSSRGEVVGVVRASARDGAVVH